MKKYILCLFLCIQNFLIQAHNSADVIIFSFNRPLQLYALLESLYMHTTDINSTTVIYRASNERYNQAFNHVASQFPNAQFLHQQTIIDFKTLTIKALENSSSDYVIFAVDDNIVKDKISLHECITWLEQTNAYGFYLKLGSHLNYCYTENGPQKVPPLTSISDSILAWEFEKGEKDWHYPNTVDMTLYRKKDLISLFKSLEYTN
ncbi:MAG TPA: hypothetical protein VHX42_03580, partial [Candidatus Babeliales bacterium]|nr:hypothetical protein [Candidatus Babeliales bacterium]